MSTMSDLRAQAKELGIPSPFGVSKEELAKKINDAEEKIIAPTITTRELTNPELEPLRVMNDVVANTETEDQRAAAFEREIRDKIQRENIEKRLRKEAEIANRKAAQNDKYNLKYDLVDMKAQCTFIAESGHCQFQIDTKPDGSLVGTYHIFGNGKINCGNLAQPLETIKRDVRIFCKTLIESDMHRRTDMVRSQFTGEPIATPITYVGQTDAAAAVGDIANIAI